MGKTEAVLKEFLADWLRWAEAGGHDNGIFRNDHGLCGALRYWHCRKYKGAPVFYADLRALLSGMFAADGLDRCYPFNGNRESFIWEHGSHYKNPQRLAWVREHISKGEPE